MGRRVYFVSVMYSRRGKRWGRVTAGVGVVGGIRISRQYGRMGVVRHVGNRYGVPL